MSRCDSGRYRGSPPRLGVRGVAARWVAVLPGWEMRLQVICPPARTVLSLLVTRSGEAGGSLLPSASPCCRRWPASGLCGIPGWRGAEQCTSSLQSAELPFPGARARCRLHLHRIWSRSLSVRAGFSRNEEELLATSVLTVGLISCCAFLHF